MVGFERWGIGSDLLWCSGGARGSPGSKLMSGIKLCIVGKWKGRREGALFTEEGSRSYLCFVIQMGFILLCAMQSGVVLCRDHTHTVYSTCACIIWMLQEKAWVFFIVYLLNTVISKYCVCVYGWMYLCPASLYHSWRCEAEQQSACFVFLPECFCQGGCRCFLICPH